MFAGLMSSVVAVMQIKFLWPIIMFLQQFYYLRRKRYMFLGKSVCLFVCLSVCQLD